MPGRAMGGHASAVADGRSAEVLAACQQTFAALQATFHFSIGPAKACRLGKL